MGKSFRRRCFVLLTKRERKSERIEEKGKRSRWSERRTNLVLSRIMMLCVILVCVLSLWRQFFAESVNALPLPVMAEPVAGASSHSSFRVGSNDTGSDRYRLPDVEDALSRMRGVERHTPADRDEVLRRLADKYGIVRNFVSSPAPHAENGPVATESHDTERMKNVARYIAVMNPSLSAEDGAAVAKSIVKWSDYYGVPTHIVVGIAHVESNFRPGAKGPQTPSGVAAGVMQVMYGVHSALLAKEGIPTLDAVLTADGGVRAGCLIFSRYLGAEKSISAALGRYFSQLDSRYILEKVVASALTFSQLDSGFVEPEQIREAHQRESKTMALLTKAPPAPKRRAAAVSRNGTKGNPNSYARITLAAPARAMTVYGGPKQ